MPALQFRASVFNGFVDGGFVFLVGRDVGAHLRDGDLAALQEGVATCLAPVFGECLGALRCVLGQEGVAEVVQFVEVLECEA